MISDTDFNLGLAMYLEWGPVRSTPIEERLAKAFPSLTKARIAKLIGEYREIESAAHRCVINQLEDKKTEDVGRRAVANLAPRLSSENAAMLYTQARVSAWRDGYS